MKKERPHPFVAPMQHPLNKMLFSITVLLLMLPLSSSIAQTICMSEIMADNDTTLQDEDGDSPDWIELYNNTDAAVSLDGWYLANSSTNLTEWRFPATNMAANSFLLLFASDKDRAIAGEELHTNFKLSASGEYIALVRPDGSTIEDEMTYPALDEDVSFGYTFSSSSAEPEVILNTTTACTAHIPTSETDASGWTTLSFDDSGWLSGTTGVGYDESTTYQGLIGLDVMTMQNTNESVYIRVPFYLDQPTSIASLTLNMKYDDGFVAYINGTQVAASSTAPATPTWNSGASNHADSLATVFEAFDIDQAIQSLQSGTNLLAIHGMNYRTSSSDLIFMPQIEATLFDGGIDLSAAGLLATPTPGIGNASISYAGVVETPVTFPERGFYDTPVQVSVTNKTSGAIIRYTLDGSEPTESSPEYTGPVTLSSTINFRVRAFIDGWKPSFPRTDTYLFVTDTATRPKTTDTINGQALEFGMDADVLAKTYYDASNQVVTVADALKAIPTISLSTDAENLYDPSVGIYVNAQQRWEVPASAELINPDGSEGFHINAGLRIRGGASRNSNNPKHSFRLFFRDEYGQSKLNAPLFEDEGVQAFKKIDLRSAQNYSWSKDNSVQNSFLRDVFARDLAADMGDAYTRSRYYHLYVNGEYWGLFMTEERPVADFGASYFGGDSDDYDVVKVIGRGQTDAYSIEATDGNLDAYNRLYAAAMAGFTNNVDYFSIQGMDGKGAPDATKEKLLDVENMIDYLLAIYYTAASDNCITWFVGQYKKLNNMYAMYNRVNPDGFKWFLHDCEHSLDTYKALDFTGPFTNSNFTLPQYFNAMTLHDKLVVNEEYRIKFADQVYKQMYNNGAMVRTNCEQRLDARAAQIDRAIVANAARWGSTSLDRDTWTNTFASTRAFFARSGDRCNEVISYLDADGLIPSILPPQLSQHDGLVDSGTTISLSASEGTIYYTTDGTDPRAIGGAVAGDSYTGPIVITKPTHLKARCRTAGGEWSALAAATFWTPEVPLAVTEVMYHAPGGNDHDFIEIKNISDETVSLKGYTFDNAIDFKFKNSAQTALAPGDYLVAIDDIDAFTSTYTNSNIQIAGEFSGNLSNSGEKVDLEFRDNDIISFTYDDARNWPQAADGAGHSLIPLDLDHQESASLDYGGNWRASTYTGGSPGAEDPQLATTVVLNEIMAHTDTDLAPPYDSNDKIELFNTSSESVTLNGWYLSDDLDSPEKWPIPSTTLPAHGFVIFDESDFHFSTTNGFGLNKAGEQVLLSAPGRVVDAVRFKGQENVSTGESWGRYPDGTGHWMMTAITEEAPNQPIAATVRINELMYNPALPGNDYEYIQIKNISTSSVTLENEIGPYRIDGGIEYSFPPGITLAPDERCWILSFNPTNTVKRAQFCAAYGLNEADETFLGGYAGSLSDHGERVALERPQDSDDPLKPLDLSWVVVDELYYFDQAPWPTSADGTGYPLQRTGLTSWNVPPTADVDADSIPDNWEYSYFQTLAPSLSDWDADGQSNQEEYIAGSNPTNALSRFIIENNAGATLEWTAITGRTYSVYWTDNLALPFSRIASNLTSGVYTDEAPALNSPNYYRIKVELAE